MEVIIDKKIASFLWPLTDDEYAELEESILADGLREAIIVWQKEKNDDMIIVDGHNRYKICKKHNIQLRTRTKEFTSYDDVEIWVRKNQAGRRNSNDFQRIENALALKELLAKAAKTHHFVNVDKMERLNTRKEIAKKAEVSEGTVHKVEKILDEAPKKIVNATRKGELSINAAYNTVRPNLQKDSAKKKTALRFGGAFQITIENINGQNQIRRGRGNVAFKQSDDSQEVIDPSELIQEIKEMIEEKGMEII